MYEILQYNSVHFINSMKLRTHLSSTKPLYALRLGPRIAMPNPKINKKCMSSKQPNHKRSWYHSLKGLPCMLFSILIYLAY